MKNKSINKKSKGRAGALAVGALVMALTIFLAACGGSGTTTAAATPPPSEPASSESGGNTEDPGTAITTNDQGELVLTLEELAEFDGKDGRPAYVAIDGLIYDLTNVGAWANGSHNGQSAGKDLTSAIDSLSPHGRSVLDNVPVIGRLAD